MAGNFYEVKPNISLRELLELLQELDQNDQGPDGAKFHTTHLLQSQVDPAEQAGHKELEVTYQEKDENSDSRDQYVNKEELMHLLKSTSFFLQNLAVNIYPKDYKVNYLRFLSDGSPSADTLNKVLNGQAEYAQGADPNAQSLKDLTSALLQLTLVLSGQVKETTKEVVPEFGNISTLKFDLSKEINYDYQLEQSWEKTQMLLDALIDPEPSNQVILPQPYIGQNNFRVPETREALNAFVKELKKFLQKADYQKFFTHDQSKTKIFIAQNNIRLDRLEDDWFAQKAVETILVTDTENQKLESDGEKAESLKRFLLAILKDLGKEVTATPTGAPEEPAEEGGEAEPTPEEEKEKLEQIQQEIIAQVAEELYKLFEFDDNDLNKNLILEILAENLSAFITLPQIEAEIDQITEDLEKYVTGKAEEIYAQILTKETVDEFVNRIVALAQKETEETQKVVEKIELDYAQVPSNLAELVERYRKDQNAANLQAIINDPDYSLYLDKLATQISASYLAGFMESERARLNLDELNQLAKKEAIKALEELIKSDPNALLLLSDPSKEAEFKSTYLFKLVSTISRPVVFAAQRQLTATPPSSAGAKAEILKLLKPEDRGKVDLDRAIYAIFNNALIEQIDPEWFVDNLSPAELAAFFNLPQYVDTKEFKTKLLAYVKNHYKTAQLKRKIRQDEEDKNKGLSNTDKLRHLQQAGTYWRHSEKLGDDGELIYDALAADEEEFNEFEEKKQKLIEQFRLAIIDEYSDLEKKTIEEEGLQNAPIYQINQTLNATKKSGLAGRLRGGASQVGRGFKNVAKGLDKGISTVGGAADKAVQAGLKVLAPGVGTVLYSMIPKKVREYGLVGLMGLIGGAIYWLVSKFVGTWGGFIGGVLGTVALPGVGTIGGIALGAKAQSALGLESLGGPAQFIKGARNLFGGESKAGAEAATSSSSAGAWTKLGTTGKIFALGGATFGTAAFITNSSIPGMFLAGVPEGPIGEVTPKELQVIKEVDPASEVGPNQEVTYSLTILTHLQPGESITDINIQDEILPDSQDKISGFSLLVNAIGGACTVAGQTLSCTIDKLETGEGSIIAYGATTSNLVTTDGKTQISNRVTVTGQYHKADGSTTELTATSFNVINGSGELVAQKSLDITAGLQQGWWKYYNYHPQYPELFGMREFIAFNGEPPPCQKENNCPTESTSPTVMFWCTWNVIKSYEQAGRPIAEETGVVGMREWFDKNGDYTDEIGVENIKVGDVIFYGKQRYNFNSNTLIGEGKNAHVAIVTAVNTLNIETTHSNNSLINVSHTISDGQPESPTWTETDESGKKYTVVLKINGFGRY